jgi:hypothetical protein
VETLNAEWYGFMGRHAKCLPKVRAPHVYAVTETAGVIGYLTKEVTAENDVLDFAASSFLDVQWGSGD